MILEHRLLHRLEDLSRRVREPALAEVFDDYLPRVRLGRDRIERLEFVTRQARRRGPVRLRLVLARREFSERSA